MPPPRRSTLFPYTTLFRSAPRRGRDAADDEIARRLAGDPEPGSDRKSTRLNSSHLGISYAVFCLKKTKATSPCTSRRQPRLMQPTSCRRRTHADSPETRQV